MASHPDRVRRNYDIDFDRSTSAQWERFFKIHERLATGQPVTREWLDEARRHLPRKLTQE